MGLAEIILANICASRLLFISAVFGCKRLYFNPTDIVFSINPFEELVNLIIIKCLHTKKSLYQKSLMMHSFGSSDLWHSGKNMHLSMGSLHVYYITSHAWQVHEMTTQISILRVTRNHHLRRSLQVPVRKFINLNIF